MTAKFKKNGTLIVGTQLLTASYDYKVYSPKNSKQEYLMIKDKSDSNRIIKYVYTISDDKNNGYVLKPVQKKMRNNLLVESMLSMLIEIGLKSGYPNNHQN